MLEETIIAVVADHGGYRNTHGITPPMIAEVYVPLLLRGMRLYPIVGSSVIHLFYKTS